MRRFWIILSIVLTFGGLLFAYGRRFISKLSFDVDFEPQILSWKDTSFVSPLIIYIDNKNKKSITVHNLKLKLYDSNNSLLAESTDDKNKYFVEGFKNNKLKHNFTFYLSSELKEVIRKQIKNEPINLYIVASFEVFLIPISVKEEIKLN